MRVTQPYTPFGYNDTLYPNPAAPIDSLVNENDDETPSYSSDDYIDYESMDESELTPEQR